MERKVNVNDFLNESKFIEWQLFKTQELNLFWNAYLEKYPETKEILDQAIYVFAQLNINKAILSQEEQVELLNRLRKSLKDHQRRKFNSKRIISLAASIILVFSISFYLLTSEKLNIEQVVGHETGGINIQFVNSSVSCNINQNAVLDFSKQNSVIITNENGDVIENIETTESMNNKLIVPRGKRSSLILSDGTKVWLNAGAEIVFPSSFKGDYRNVQIKGEAYLDVAKDPAKPFIVKTQDFDIKVLGTQFNISSSSSSSENTVVLVEGSVAVDLKNGTIETIKPNQMFSLVGTKVDIKEVDTNEYTAWKDGLLVFKQQSLQDILKVLERYYDISFDNTNLEFTKNTFSGKLYLSDSLDEMLTSIASLASLNFEKTNDRYILKNKKPN